ncbi:MAG: hypothetical protein LBD58_08415 [Treponema sp.]|nr:hypothetical protein [Treponema sp.]
MTMENKRILDGIRKQRRQGRVEATPPRDIRGVMPEREAALQLRCAAYSVKRPHILNPAKTLPDCIDMQVVYVKEEEPPKGKEPIAWFLAAGEPANSPEEAYECVGHYMRRWKMERFRYALKSGRTIEKLQERSIDKSATLVLMRPIWGGR